MIMYSNAASILREQNNEISNAVTAWIKRNHAYRTTEYEKCTRDVSYIIKSLAYCLEDNNSFSIDHISTMFFTKGVFQLKTVNVEFKAYDYLLVQIKGALSKAEDGAFDHCSEMINKLKKNIKELNKTYQTNDNKHSMY
jgi:hypothetical protein